MAFSWNVAPGMRMMYLGSSLRGGKTYNKQHFSNFGSTALYLKKLVVHLTWICFGSLVICAFLLGLALYVRIVLPIATPRKL